MDYSPAPISAYIWKRHLLWAEDFFLFPTKSRVPLSSPAAAFRFASTGRTLIVRSKSGATYTGPSLRALLIRITDSGMLDDNDDENEHGDFNGDGDDGDTDVRGHCHRHHAARYDEEQLFLGPGHKQRSGYGYGRREKQGRFLPTELDTGTCILEFWEDRDLARYWPSWEKDTTQIQCSSKWYSEILGWDDEKIKMEFGLAAVIGPGITPNTPISS